MAECKGMILLTSSKVTRVRPGKDSGAWTTSEVTSVLRSWPDNGKPPCSSSLPTAATSMATVRGGLRVIPWTSRLLAPRRPLWTCVSRRNGDQSFVVRPRSYATAASAESIKKPYYVTTPIFYVNAGKEAYTN